MLDELLDVVRVAGERMRPAGAGLVRLRRGVHADLVAARPAEQAVDGHAPELAGDVPQGHVDAGDDVRHERPAADVAVRAVELLPEVFDARGVLAVEQLEQRLGQAARALSARRPVTSPQPVMLVVGLDAVEALRPGGKGLDGGDFDVAAFVGDIGAGELSAGHVLGQEKAGGGEAAAGGEDLLGTTDRDRRG